MRIRDWRIVLLFLLYCCFVERCFAVSGNTSVVIPHQADPAIEHEFQNVYSSINLKATISSGAGAPATTPSKVGDIYINTSAGKVYVSTGTVTSGSWAILN